MIGGTISMHTSDTKANIIEPSHLKMNTSGYWRNTGFRMMKGMCGTEGLKTPSVRPLGARIIMIASTRVSPFAITVDPVGIPISNDKGVNGDSEG